MSQYETVSCESSFHVEAAGLSVQGPFALSNDDVIALYESTVAPHAQQLGRLYLLADGRGHAGSGATVGRIAIETITTVYYTQSDAHLPLGRLQQAFLAAHERVRAYTQAHPADQAMTTCTAVVIKGHRSWIAHIGDSRAYLIRPRPTCSESAITRLTSDHSLSAAYVRATLSASDDQRDVLLRALGIAPQRMALPDFTIVTLHAGDVLLLCSDGLWQALSEALMAQIVIEHRPTQACELLVRQACAAQRKENMSVVVLCCSETAHPAEAFECQAEDLAAR